MLFRYYRQLIEQVDQWTGAMTRRYQSHLACRKGCDMCCQRKLTLTPVEAYNIAKAYRQLPSETQQRVLEAKASCTFLVDGACSVYESRPIICRTFGLPSIHRNEKEEGVVSWCELNFTETSGSFELQADGIIDIDTLNLKLSGVNGLFLKESDMAGERIAMDEIPKIDTRVLQGDH